MTIVEIGKNRMAYLSASTWVYTGVGTGTATVNSTDTWLNTSVLVKSVGVALPLNNTCSFNSRFDFSEGNTTATITEMILADQSTSAGNILLRSVASTNTWTSFTKRSDRVTLISMELVLST